MFMLTDELKNGSNTPAVHTHQARGGQCIDLAVLVESCLLQVVR